MEDPGRRSLLIRLRMEESRQSVPVAMSVGRRLYVSGAYLVPEHTLAVGYVGNGASRCDVEVEDLRKDVLVRLQRMR